MSTSSVARVGIVGGGTNIFATQNVQYNIFAPSVEKMLLPKTDITARINTISGTSINDGTNLTQSSFANDGVFSDVILGEDNYLYEPALICSTINESSELSGAKSFRMDLSLTSGDTKICLLYTSPSPRD